MIFPKKRATLPYNMNCLLFDTPPPFALDKENPKLEHINSVLKLDNGGKIFAGQKNGKLFICELKRLDNGNAQLCPIEETSNPPHLEASLAVAFARPQIAQRLLFEAACFGVKNLVFYAATKGERDYIKSGLYANGEYQKWLEKGAEQACATAIPDFYTAENIMEAVEKIDTTLPSNAVKIAPDVYEAETTISRAISGDAHIATILGSERGFANPDRQLLRERGYKLVSLGNRVLRTDSAVIATLSAITIRR